MIAEMMSVLHLDRLRVGHIHYMAMAVMVLFLSFIIYPIKQQIDPASTFLTFLHLLMFTAQFGAQLWVTLVAGVTMFCSLPRRMFGQVQKRLFPMFFFWCYITSVLTIATFLLKAPFDNWSTIHYKQMYALTASFISAATNTLILAPVIVTAMLKTFDMEVTAGVGDVVGYADIKDLKTNEEYIASYSTFRKCHGFSAFLTVVALIANTLYLYNLCSNMLLLGGVTS